MNLGSHKKSVSSTHRGSVVDLTVMNKETDGDEKVKNP
jgi:hypothetical protein